MSRIPSDRKCVEFLIDAGCKKRVAIHCATVRAVADEMTAHIPEADKALVTAGALLHDIGRSVDHSILHAYYGAQIAERLSLPRSLIDIILKHTGAGLDEQDVEEMGLPYAYDHFAEGESPDPPFICFLYPKAENFGADNLVYHHFNRLDIEVYTDYKDPDMEASIEEVLTAHELYYEKSEVWIETEKMYEVLYELTV